MTTLLKELGLALAAYDAFYAQHKGAFTGFEAANNTLSTYDERQRLEMRLKTALYSVEQDDHRGPDTPLNIAMRARLLMGQEAYAIDYDKVSKALVGSQMRGVWRANEDSDELVTHTGFILRVVQRISCRSLEIVYKGTPQTMFEFIVRVQFETMPRVSHQHVFEKELLLNGSWVGYPAFAIAAQGEG